MLRDRSSPRGPTTSPRAAFSWTLIILFVTLITGLALCAPPGATAKVVDEDPYELFNKAKQLQQEGRYSEAIRKLTRAIEIFGPDDPNSLLVRVAKAKALMRNRRLKEAKEELTFVLTDARIGGETEASAWHVMGLIKLRDRDPKKAKEAFTRAIKAHHENNELKASSYANRAYILTRLDLPEEALSDIGQALRLHPDYAYAYAVAAVARLKQKNTRQAEKNAERALSMSSDSNTRTLARSVLRNAERVRRQEKIVAEHRERFRRQAEEFERATEKLASKSTVLYKSRDRLILNIGPNGHVFVKVKFGQYGTHMPFLLDTGATHTLISQAMLMKIKKETEVKQIGKSLARTADGSVHPIVTYLVKDAYLYDLPLGNIKVQVMARERGVPMSLLGVKSLRNVRIAIDPGTNKAEIRLVSR